MLVAHGKLIAHALLDLGTLYFTSIRKEKGHPFTICEFTFPFPLESLL